MSVKTTSSSISSRTRSQYKNIGLLKDALQTNKNVNITVNNVISYLSLYPHLYTDYISTILDLVYTHSNNKSTISQSQEQIIITNITSLQSKNISDVDKKLIVFDYIFLNYSDVMSSVFVFTIIKNTLIDLSDSLKNPFTKKVILFYLRKIIEQMLHF